jgi:hypothetical protein
MAMTLISPEQANPRIDPSFDREVAGDDPDQHGLLLRIKVIQATLDRSKLLQLVPVLEAKTGGAKHMPESA